MSNNHPSILERTELCGLRVTEKQSMSTIAAIMKRSKSTISRELKRNTEEVYKVYLPDTAEEKMKKRRKNSKKRFQKYDNATITEIKHQLKQHYSPE